MRALRFFATRCLLAGALLLATPAWAQLRAVPPVDALLAGQRANAFVHWAGSEPLNGLEVEVPEGWSLYAARGIRDGSMVTTDLRVTALGGHRYALEAEQPLRGSALLVLGLDIGEERGYRTMTLTPGPETAGGREEWTVYVSESPAGPKNPAFGLPEGSAPVALRRSQVPGIGRRDGYTVEFWIKTTGLNEVVLSTWDGDEERPYPLEVVIDPRGRVVLYRGRPGRHEALVSARPVADGQWHHVAFVNDPSAGRARLLVNGLEADSLRIDDAEVVMNTMSLVLGGRPERPGVAPRRVFSGLLDELRLWNTARDPAALRRTMRVPMDAMPEGSLRLGFDEPLPPELLVAPPEREVRTASDLRFAFPVEAFEASVEGGIVTLTWQTKDRRAEAFRVERSADGRRFEAIGTVRAEERLSESADGAARFAHTDLPPSGQVLYYRIRQIAPEGAEEPEQVSGILKLGLGSDEAPAAAIVGNSPNPFREHTTISYDLAQAGPVTLSVWDVSGTRVAVLVDETLPAGRHAYRFSADGLPSGVYFVRLETPGGNAVHKMALTR